IHMGDGEAVQFGMRQHPRRPAGGAAGAGVEGGQAVAAEGWHDGGRIGPGGGGGKGFRPESWSGKRLESVWQTSGRTAHGCNGAVVFEWLSWRGPLVVLWKRCHYRL